MKLRQPHTIEDAVMRVLAAIGREAAAEAVGKSAAMVYRWADPDDTCAPRLIDCLALDAAYVAAGHGEAPILAAYRDQVAGIQSSHAAMNAADRLCDVMHEVGDVAGEVRASLDPRGEGGDGVTRREHARMSAEIAEAVAALQALQRDIDHAAGLTGPSPVREA